MHLAGRPVALPSLFDCRVTNAQPSCHVSVLLTLSSAPRAAWQWASGPGGLHQSLGATLQKPLLVAELGFLLAVTQFVVPTFTFVKSSPIPFATHDVLLTGGRARGVGASSSLPAAPRVSHCLWESSAAA